MQMPWSFADTQLPRNIKSNFDTEYLKTKEKLRFLRNAYVAPSWEIIRWKVTPPSSSLYRAACGNILNASGS